MEETVLSSRIANQKFQLWMKADQHKKILKELETFGGATISQQFTNFLTWYFKAKDEGNLFKPANERGIKRDVNAPSCEFHALSEGKWFCDDKTMPEEVCLTRYRRHCRDGKKCLPAKLEPKPRAARFIKDDSGRGKVDWGDQGNGGFFDFSER